MLAEPNWLFADKNVNFLFKINFKNSLNTSYKLIQEYLVYFQLKPMHPTFIPCYKSNNRKWVKENRPTLQISKKKHFIHRYCKTQAAISYIYTGFENPLQKQRYSKIWVLIWNMTLHIINSWKKRSWFGNIFIHEPNPPLWKLKLL